MDERKRFLVAYQRNEVSFSALCRQFGVSRPTGYKWLERYRQLGESGLADESRAPWRQTRRTPAGLEDQILALRARHPSWGPKKLLGYLHDHHPRQPWPALSTIGDLLRREGLTHPRARRRRTPAYSQPLAHAEAPNDVWCADFKGWFLCQNGQRCDPLTITDAYSRYLIRCRSVPKTDGPHARQVFESAFREFGLPAAIRTDNGCPFATPGLAGLSRLSVWWIRLGILPERIAPASPQQNGRHERFHLTLQQETARPPRSTLAAQQRAFDRFQNEYNAIRPHEAIGQHPPASLYLPSRRTFPAHLPHLAYPFGVTLRHVSAAGHLGWKGHQIYVSILLEGEDVALRELEDELFEVHFGPLLLGWLDAPSATFTPNRPPPRHRRHLP